MQTSNKTKKSFNKQSIFLLATTVIGGAFGYIFQLLAGKFLSVEQYGEMSSLFSVLNTLIVIGTTGGIIISKVIIENIERSAQKSKRILFVWAVFSGIILVGEITALSLFMGYPLSSSIFVSIATAAYVYSYSAFGILQGHKDFFGTGMMNLLNPAIKCFLGIPLIIGAGIFLYPDLSYNGGFVAIAIGSVIAFLYGCFRAKKNGFLVPSAQSEKIEFRYYKQFFIGLLSLICIGLFNNIDVLLVRQYFDEATVGIYSAAALFGKIILYIPQALIIIMTPLVAENKQNGIKILFKTLIESIGLSSVCVLALFLCRNFVFSILMGEQYKDAGIYILPVSFMMISLVCLTVLVNYLIAAGKELISVIICILSAASVFIITLFLHSSVNGMICGIASIYAIFSGITLAISKITQNMKQEAANPRVVQ